MSFVCNSGSIGNCFGVVLVGFLSGWVSFACCCGLQSGFAQCVPIIGYSALEIIMEASDWHSWTDRIP
jgi:hypothetical protein